MIIAATAKRAEKAPRHPRARSTGAVYLLYFLTAIAAALLSARGLVVFGLVTNVIANVVYLAVTLLFYRLFKPVDQSVSLVAAFFSVVGCLIQTLALFHLAPGHLSPLLFFGPYCVLVGYLIFRSTFVPPLLGGLMVLAGFGWLAILSPAIANHLASYIKVLGVLAEASLMLWLLVVGVNVRKWNEKRP